MNDPKMTDKHYWRSLKELETTRHSDSEQIHPDTDNELSRRKFLSLMGASMAFAGLTACRRPVEKIIPYVVGQEDIIPGVPLYYASAIPFASNPVGVLVENHEGRPTKVDGNALHPASQGKADAYVQASILNLYDPDRTQQPLQDGKPSDYSTFLASWKKRLTALQKGKGNVAVIASEHASPTLRRLKKSFMAAMPDAVWATYEPVNDEQIRNGIEMATGMGALPDYHLRKAQVILSLDADFLQTERNAIRNANEFADGRRVKDEHDSMNRLYVAESSYSLTGAMADHRYKLQNNHIPAFTAALAIELEKLGIKVPGRNGIKSAGFSFDKSFLKAVAVDLIHHKGAGVIMAGRRQPAHVHALVCAMNEALENHESTVEYHSYAQADLSDSARVSETLDTILKGDIDTVIFIGGNIAYDGFLDMHVRAALKKADYTVHLGSHFDETANLCQWHIPESHYMESWGDTISSDGIYSIIQPQISPLYKSVSALEFVNDLAGNEPAKGYDLVRDTFRQFISAGNFEKKWRKVLHDGIYQSNSTRLRVKPVAKLIEKGIKKNSFAMRTATATNLEITLQVSPSVYDGRFANNGWLQELPDPITKLTWSNAALMSPKTAEALGLENESLAALRWNGVTMDIPVWITPGQADFSVTIELGYGRTHCGRIGDNVGVNAYRWRIRKRAWSGLGGVMTNTGRRTKLAGIQEHNGMNGDALADRGVQDRLPMIIREATLEEYRKHPEFAEEAVEHPPLVSLWEEKQYTESPQWGMSIDLNVCTGCNACTIACQSENNIPIVGADEVRRGREMHWIRIDRYFTGDVENPQSVVQPVGCQQCELAPCEQVCPVGATTHTDDGINGMTYNRCVGTRYCSNNCPYKVRHFNFHNYTKELPEIVQMAMNPDVTVRFRGVMEKCTFCIQRVNQAKINAKKDDRAIRDGDVVSACQQTCPTDAIVFGDITDPNARVSLIKKQNRDYALLGELNTKPRVTYQAKLRNPNPELS